MHVDAKKGFAELIVPTPDLVSYAWILKHVARQMRGVLCVGPTGTSKTTTVKQTLMSGLGEPSTYSPIFITFSAQTSANQTQDLLDGKFDKRYKGFYGPPVGKRYTIFVDDLNMPKREEYGAQPPIEILRQWYDQQGWYDRKSYQFTTILDITFVGAMGPPGGGREPVSNRFLRHFVHVAFPDMSDGSLKLIFGSVFSAHLELHFPGAGRSRGCFTKTDARK